MPLAPTNPNKAPNMADDAPPNVGPTWLTYPELADRLGLPTAAAAAARARRAKWPKRLRNDTGQAEVEVPAEALSATHKSPPDARPPRRPYDTPDVAGDAVRAAVAPLQALLDAQAGELRDALGELTIAKADAAAAKARADTLAAQVEREVMDRRTLQAQGDDLRDQLHATQLDAAKAHGDARTEAAKREAAEARAADLQRQVEQLQARRRRWWPFG